MFVVGSFGYQLAYGLITVILCICDIGAKGAGYSFP